MAVRDVDLNGKLTEGENLADLGGLWLAWLAWLDKAQAAHVDMNATMDVTLPIISDATYRPAKNYFDPPQERLPLTSLSRSLPMKA